jgi:hypothetical protein
VSDLGKGGGARATGNPAGKMHLKDAHEHHFVDGQVCAHKLHIGNGRGQAFNGLRGSRGVCLCSNHHDGVGLAGRGTWRRRRVPMSP